MLNWEPYNGLQTEGPFRKSNSQIDLVTRLIDTISGTGRNVMSDNFLTSFSLIKCLIYNHRLSMLGTVRKNKRELPPEFVNTKQRPIKPCLFGFQDDITLLSYIPKRNKNILLASSMHF